MLDTGRSKDRERISMMLDEADVDMRLLKEVITRHGLMKQWQRYEEVRCGGE